MPYPDYSQISALTRRRRRPDRSSIINQQAANLPELLNLRSQREHQTTMEGIAEAGQTLAETSAQRTAAHQTAMLNIEEANAETAEELGYANLGLSTFFNLGETETGQKVWDWAGEGLGSIWDWVGSLFG